MYCGGHRYAKAGLRTHSLNCYIQALQIYGGRGWRYAEDHVQFTIARHQAALQIYDGIVERLLSLLKTPTLQSVTQVQLFYKEFVTVASVSGCLIKFRRSWYRSDNENLCGAETL